MTSRPFKQVIFILTFFVVFPGCAYINPLIQEVNIIPLSQEVVIGQKMAAEIEREMALVKDASRLSAVRNIGNRLVQALPRRDFRYRFYVVDEKAPNAFTIPGGHIYVHTGLMDFVDDPSELAGVIAHELGHAYERHPTKSLSRIYGVAFLSSLFFKEEPGPFKQLALQLTAGGLITRYGREDEYEADEIAHYLLRHAEFSSDGLLRFFKKLERVEGTASGPEFLSSHPPTPERIAHLEELEKNPGMIRDDSRPFGRSIA